MSWQQSCEILRKRRDLNQARYNHLANLYHVLKMHGIEPSIEFINELVELKDLIRSINKAITYIVRKNVNL